MEQRKHITRIIDSRSILITYHLIIRRKNFIILMYLRSL